MEKNPIEVDLVYLWVNGNDPQWQAKYNAFIGKTTKDLSLNCKGRYADNDELKYSLRSISLYAPWVHKIFIVTDNQIPEWLDTTNPKIQIVDHKDIMPEESLPCFNSSLIEHFLYKIVLSFVLLLRTHQEQHIISKRAGGVHIWIALPLRPDIRAGTGSAQTEDLGRSLWLAQACQQASGSQPY